MERNTMKRLFLFLIIPIAIILAGMRFFKFNKPNPSTHNQESTVGSFHIKNSSFRKEYFSKEK